MKLDIRPVVSGRIYRIRSWGGKKKLYSIYEGGVAYKIIYTVVEEDLLKKGKKFVKTEIKLDMLEVKVYDMV